ncbi:uncharacterized protein LOC110905011 isoform X1 [Helianthus annuus]|uniref:uncharacterized protein LOC110905011 isoform X1 n=1 Tax=Helianthus annuus TaxID=4232 RepID=UPI000B8F402C|nr:uncharacterized protein LOC110905011 isoform X1 [Helianthus annuus]
MMKAVGGEPKSIEGVTYDTKAKIGTWKGKITFSVIPMDDYKIVLGLAFFDRSNAIPDAFLNTLYLIKDKEVHTAPMETDTRHRGKTLSTMQIVRTKQQPRKQHDEGVVNLGGGECHDPPKYRILKPLSREAVFGVFSKVEDNGRYLDIYELYCMFEHTVYGRELIQRGKPMIFRKYIRSFPGLHLFEERHKRNRMYKRYMKNMLQYLTSFLTRAMPMIEVDEQMECGRRGHNIPLQEAQINGMCRFLDGFFERPRKNTPSWTEHENQGRITIYIYFFLILFINRFTT